MNLSSLRALQTRNPEIVDAVAVRLYRITPREELLACEAIEFLRGWPAIETTFRRAALSGRVEYDGQIDRHFADILNREGDMLETVALDSRSYKSLKTRWMRCNLDQELNV